MTNRKTLNLRDPADTAPNLKKKGRGWEISEKRLDALHDQARDMRRHPSDAHKALAARFTQADLGRYSFKRFQVIGSAIVDFGSHNLGLALMIDEDGSDDALAKRRDKSLEAVGIRVVRLSASEVLENIDDVLARLTVIMREQIAAKSKARSAHYASHPRTSAPKRSHQGPRSREK